VINIYFTSVLFSFESVPYVCSLMFHGLMGLVCGMMGIIMAVIVANVGTITGV
jgi:hypothetical protein